MPLTTSEINYLLDQTRITYAALFDGDPSSGGTECSGGGYARQAVTWGSASGAVKAASNQPQFSVPSGFTVRWAAYYSVSSGGTLLAKHDVTDEAFSSAGLYTLTVVSITGS